VLIAIVQEEDIRAERLGGAPGLRPPPGDDDRDARKLARQGHRLVASFVRTDQGSASLRYHDHPAREPAVASRQDGRFPTLEAQPAGQQLDEGCLARASERQVAHGDDRTGKSVDSRSAGRVPPRPGLEQGGIEGLEG